MTGRHGPAGRTLFTLSETETFELGQTMARSFKGGELIVLIGELGLGKTVFARGVAAGLGIPIEEVSSPSFTLVQEYRGGRVPMYHIDLYRLLDPDDTEALGLDELIASGGVVVVEWGDRLPRRLGLHAIRIRLIDMGEESRRIEIETSGRLDPTAPLSDG